jgi:hypothetical protein
MLTTKFRVAVLLVVATMVVETLLAIFVVRKAVQSMEPNHVLVINGLNQVALL